MKTSLFDFDLPQSLIANRPVSPRDTARMLVVAPGSLEDRVVRDLPAFLTSHDVMVFNDTRVFPARLLGKRGEVRVEVLLHKPFFCHPRAGGDLKPHPISPEILAHASLGGDDKGCVWRTFARPAKRLKTGDRIEFAPDFHAVVIEKRESGEVVLRFDDDEAALRTKCARYGHVPLPPYIARKADARDHADYQTVYAAPGKEGSVAAPTAGLHFTDTLLQAIDTTGATRASVTLQVGAGTFLPVKAEDTQDHVMHSETAEVSAETAKAVNRARAAGGRVIAIGTTSARTLESAADEAGELHPFHGETDIFITPGYRFRCVDMLLTNFHLPRSTLFMLVCAFTDMERMREAYAHAIAQRYRFYSYGDACLLYKNTAA